MSKNKPKRRTGFPAPETKPKPVAPNPAMSDKRPMRWGLIALFLTISIGGTYLAIWLRPGPVKEPRFTFELINVIPHDEKAFTQGTIIDDGILWESTGRYGESTIRKIDLKTGEILKKVDLDEQYFGEGLTRIGDKFYQLTWKEGKAFVYDRDLNLVEEFSYDGEGWGLTTDGNELILSDGSAVLKFLDPQTFKVLRTMRVKRRNRMPVRQLNELEYAGGKIYANSYMTDLVYEIDLKTGNVTGLIDLSGLWPTRERPDDGILNGIAAIPGTQHMLVTGKLCPQAFEVKLVPVETE